MALAMLSVLEMTSSPRKFESQEILWTCQYIGHVNYLTCYKLKVNIEPLKYDATCRLRCL